MASPGIIDIDKLLESISDDQPVGTDIRNNTKPDSIYQQIKQVRNAARAVERENIYTTDNDDAKQHWKKISTLASEILTKHSKDLEISCWFIEANVRLYGFPGLRDSFKLTKALIEQYWETIYPLPDEDGMLTRVAPLAGLNGEGSEGVLISPIRDVSITDSNTTKPFALWQYQQALDIQKITDPNSRTENTAKLGYSMADIEKSVNSSSETFYVNLRDDINDCIKQYRLISKLLDKLCDKNVSPPSSNIITVLEQCLATINHLAKHKFPIAAIDPTSTEQSAMEPATLQQGGDTITSREAAFKQLHTISEFFLKTEPHSPISYIVAKAIKWGNMPLNELIGELIPDDSSREHFSSLTGVSIKNDDN